MKWLIVFALAMFMSFLEGIAAGTEERIQREAREEAAEKKAALYASLLAHCFNGATFSIGDDVIRCRRK